MWANYTGDCTDHSPSWVQACFSNTVTAWKKAGASQLWKQKSFVYRPSHSGTSFPQTDLPTHLCPLPPLEHSGVQAPQPGQFSISWPEGCQQKLVPVATSLPSFIKHTWTVMTSLQKGTASARVRELATKVWETRFIKS